MQALDEVIVVVLFYVFIVVFELVVTPLEGTAEGEVGVGVELDGNSVVVGSEYGDLLGHAPLDHGVALGDDHNSRLLEPEVDDRFDGVVTAAVVVLGPAPWGGWCGLCR